MKKTLAFGQDVIAFQVLAWATYGLALVVMCHPLTMIALGAVVGAGLWGLSVTHGRIEGR